MTKSHTINCEWSLWYYEKEAGKSWEQCFHEVAAIKSIEEFWILFNSIKLPTDINEGCNYALFRNGVRPMWEDDHNRNGGRWVIALEKRVDNDEVNRLWLDTLLVLIEEQLSSSSSICGVIFHNRCKYTKIGRSFIYIYFYNQNIHIFTITAIWVSSSVPHESVRREIRAKLRLTETVSCVFDSHRSSMHT